MTKRSIGLPQSRTLPVETQRSSSLYLNNSSLISLTGRLHSPYKGTPSGIDSHPKDKPSAAIDEAANKLFFYSPPYECRASADFRFSILVPAAEELMVYSHVQVQF